MLATLIDVVEMEIFFQMVGKLHFRRLICARQITYWIIFHHSKQASLVCVCVYVLVSGNDMWALFDSRAQNSMEMEMNMEKENKNRFKFKL